MSRVAVQRSQKKGCEQGYTFREGRELLAAKEVELPQVFEVSDTFGE